MVTERHRQQRPPARDVLHQAQPERQFAFVIPLILAGISAIQRIRAGNAAKKATLAQGKADELAAQESAAAQASASGYNKAVAEVQAQDAIYRGALEESKFRMNVRGLLGKQRAEFAGHNIDVSVGSAVDVQAETAYFGEIDALTIRNNAAREAWGYRAAGGGGGGVDRTASTAAEARYNKLIANEQAKQGKWAAAGTLLGTGLELYNTYRNTRNSGPKPKKPKKPKPEPSRPPLR